MTAESLNSRILLTGATSGIGLATARLLAPIADDLILQGPEPPDAVAPIVDALDVGSDRRRPVHYIQADYTKLAQVAALADQVIDYTTAVDLIINNAAIPGPPARTLTADHNEITFQVNYLAPVALTELLAERAEAPRRVVNVASATHLSAHLEPDNLDLNHDYSAVTAYARAKLALVAYTCWTSAHRSAGTPQTVSIHPGVIATELLHAMFGGGGASPDRAAKNLVVVAGQSGDDGVYYDETRPSEPNPIARDTSIQTRLIAHTEQRLAAAGIDVDLRRRPATGSGDAAESAT